jgi:hypothetical protein
VRAIDRNGKDAFRNNGYSEVCTFTYGGIDPDFNIGVVKSLQAEAQTERMAKIWWEPGDFEGYRVNYRKTGTGYEWFSSNITADKLKEDGDIKLYDLEPDTEYETRVQGKKKGYFGGYTDIVKFRTPPHQIPQCGDQPAAEDQDMGKPFLTGIKGSVVSANGIEVTLLEVISLGNGWYKGIGHMSIAHLAGAGFHVQFDRIYIREDRKVLRGRMDVVTEGVASLVQQQMANATVKAQQQTQKENRDAWEGTQFYDKVFTYDVAIDTITSEGIGYLNIYDASGNVTTNAEVAQILLASPDKAIIIQDKNGDQFVVQKDGDKTEITKVNGGGLNPTSSEPVTDEAIDIVRKALRAIRKEYDATKLNSAMSTMRDKKDILDKYVREQNAKTITGSEADNSGGGYYTEIAEDKDVSGTEDADFKNKSKDYKLAERQYNKMVVVQMMAKDSNTDEEITVIVQEIKINETPLASYITKAKNNGSTEDELVSETKGAIVQLIERILNEYVYDVK